MSLLLLLLLLVLAPARSAIAQQMSCTGCVPGASLVDASVTPAKILGSPTDEYYLTYEASGSTWEWQSIVAAAYTTSVSLPPALCVGSTASSAWDNPTTNAPAAACTGTNVRKATLDFDAATDESIQYNTIRLPSNWAASSDIVFKLTWSANATTVTNARWCAQVICRADGETDDQAFDTEGCLDDANKTGAVNQLNDATITLTNGAGQTDTCAAGENLHLLVYRDANHGNDTLAVDASLSAIELVLTLNPA